MDAFKHCARCGSPAIEFLGIRALRCQACGLKLYVNSAAAAAALIQYQDLLLLTVRACEPDQGKFDLPGGFVEFDESAEQCLRREVREELNLHLGDLTYLTSAPNDYLYADVLYKTMDVFFTASVDDVTGISPQDDVSGYAWVDPMSFDPEKLAFASSRIAFREFKTRMGKER